MSSFRLTSPLAAGTTVTVTVVDVKDLAGLAITTPETDTFRFTPVVSFALQLQPLLDQGCAFSGCHAADERFPPGADLVLDAGGARGQIVGVGSSQLAGSIRVVVGDPGASYLIAKLDGAGIVGDRMPVGGPFLTLGDVQLFRLWIEQGALDN